MYLYQVVAIFSFTAVNLHVDILYIATKTNSLINFRTTHFAVQEENNNASGTKRGG
jgi:hypothetical protein